MDTIHRFAGEHRWLSNFWPSPIVFMGDRFATVEHAYQASKCADGPASPVFTMIQHARTPGEAKRLASWIRLVPEWDSIRVPLMRDLLALKFAPGSALALRLLHTGDARLQEGNAWGDRFWGIDLRTGTGENWLGELLMRQRSRLQQESCEDPALAG